MVNKISRYNPKALNLDVLKNTYSDVTLGFKIKPEVKLKLASDAEQLGLTLSSYVKRLVDDGNYFMNEFKDQAKKEVEKLIKEKKELLQSISFYENDTLQKLFQEQKNKIVPYVNSAGVSVNKKIENIKDVYEIIISSFKTKSQ